MPDGGIRWTLPGGTQVITRPPTYGTDDDLPPDEARHPSEGDPAFHGIDDPPF
jgi:hypothetical protein